MNILFIAGPGRSGTTALTHYLNQHPEVLVCIERYKWLPRREVNPELFSFERILEFEEEYKKKTTEGRRQLHVGLLAEKDPARLKWIGDKTPDYAQTLDVLAINNPGASFILTYRPVEEVAESWWAISKNPRSPWLGGKDGFGIGVRAWNKTMRGIRDFIESGLNPNVLVVGYHDFFYRNDVCSPMISRFLDLEFDESLRLAWSESSNSFEGDRRRKQTLSAEQESFIEEHADREAEAAVLEHMERQRDEYRKYPLEAARALTQERRRIAIQAAKRQADTQARVQEFQERSRDLEARLSEERGRRKHLGKRNKVLAGRVKNSNEQLRAIRSSRAWKITVVLGSVARKVSRVLDGIGRRTIRRK